MEKPEALLRQLSKLDQRGLKALTAHYESAIFFDRLELTLSLISLFAALAATVLSAIIAVIPQPYAALRVCAAVAAGLASMFTAARLQLRSGEQSERHRQTGHRYGAVRRDVEAFIARVSDGRAALEGLDLKLDALSAAYTEAGADAPSTPGHIWQRMIRRFGGSSAPGQGGAGN